MKSKIIFVLFLVVGLLANQALSHSYWIAFCYKNTAGKWLRKDIKHVFCEAKNFADCNNKWTDYSDFESRPLGQLGPCYVRKRSFSDHRGQHILECNGGSLVALRHHENQTKDNCAIKYKHEFEMKENLKCFAKWKCGN